LRTLAAHLAPHGQIAFATRNPDAREWEQWTESQSQETYESPVLGTCTVHWQIDAVDAPLRLRESEEDNNRSVQSQQVLVGKPSDLAPEARLGDSCELVDHQP
jgi:hypothetical protein